MSRTSQVPSPSLSLLVLTLLFALSCSTLPGVRDFQDPFLQGFSDKARLIMTDEELRIWKLLPDENSRREFIEEFWRVRDPDPGTDENEAREEFEERIRYANTWFGTHNPRRGKESRNEDEEGSRRGWNEDRGRIYIILGPPDVIQFIGPGGEQISFDGSRFRPGAEQWTHEQWIYDRYRLFVLFSRSSGGAWRIASYDSQLFEVLDWAKLNWVYGDFREDVERRFKFEAKWTGSGLRIIIPVNRVNFDENLKAEFGFNVGVYRDGQKVGTIEETRTLEKTEDELFEMKNIEFEIPYRAKEKGRYIFDVVVQDRMAPALSKYRAFVRRAL